MTATRERTAHAILVSDALAHRLLESVVGSGSVNPLSGLIREGMTGADALQLRDLLNETPTSDGGTMMTLQIAHFASACARRAVQGGK